MFKPIQRAIFHTRGLEFTRHLATRSYTPPKPQRTLLSKVAIVTGAGSPPSTLGNGAAISLLLAEDSATVICVDKSLSLATQTASLITSSHPASIPLPIQADVTIPSDCKRVVDTTLSKFGRLDILINVVGILGTKGNAADLDLDEWDDGMLVNVKTMVAMSKYAIRAMRRNEKTEEHPIRGSIVNLGSVAGLRGGTPSLLYPTSKGAVVNMTRAMAAQHGVEGIRVNCVCPGMMYSPMMYRDGMTDEMREARKRRSLLGTEGNVWDCASVVRFLAGDEARWITGVALPVDAGATAAVGLSM
ncbi:hypothetical protein OQA88_2655 [Cercophora sp. LCS_1]